jgi:hypothetical protein
MANSIWILPYAGCSFAFPVCVVSIRKERVFMAYYTDEQKNSIVQMPAAILLEAMAADSGNPVVSMREFMAGEKFISEAGSLFPHNALIQDMVKDVNLPKLEEVVKYTLSLGDRNAMQAECLRKIDSGLTVLARDEEANQFKSFLVALAEKVVSASGEGFFGNRGARVSTKEAAYIDQLKRQLGRTSVPIP